MSLPLVLLPGMMCDARLFAPQVAAFAPGRSVQVPSLAGHDSMAALAASVLDQAPPRFALAGLSMGGIVAMEIMAQAPDRVAGLALLDTNPLAETPERQALRSPQMTRAQAGGLAEILRDEMKPMYLAPGPNRAEILRLCMDMALDLGPAVFVRQSRALRDRPDYCETLRRVQVPALVLCGREDRLCPIDRHDLMHDLIGGARQVVIDGAGHLPVLEQPRATNAALADWLSRVDALPDQPG